MRVDEDGMAAAAAGQASQFSGSLLDILDRVEYYRVRLDVPDDPVYRLRYEAYTREGFMPFNEDGICFDDLDTAPNASCFGIYIDGRLVSSLRFHLLTPDQRRSPSFSVFPDVLGPMLDTGMTFIDPSRFTADHEASLAYPALPFLTLRIAAMASVHYNADICLALVRPEHGPFYKRVFGSTKMGEERDYPGLTFPVGLYGAEVSNIRGKVARRYPFFLSTPQERSWLFDEAEARGYQGRIGASARTAYETALALSEDAAV